MHLLAVLPGTNEPVSHCPFIQPEGRHYRLHRTPIGQQRHNYEKQVRSLLQPIQRRACRPAKRLAASLAFVSPFPRTMDDDIPLSYLASGTAFDVGAELFVWVHCDLTFWRNLNSRLDKM